MSSISDIISKNNSTFYNFRTGKRTAVLPRLSLSMGAAGLFSFLFQSGSDNLLLGLITVQSILAGFAFNAMFFLVNLKAAEKAASTGTPKQNTESDFIEDRISNKRLSTLSEEIFYNVSYFNLLAISCLCLSIVCLLPHFDLIKYIPAPQSESNVLTKYLREGLPYFQVLFGQLIYAILYFFAIESFYTFGRLVSRIGFLFEQKLDITKP